MLVAAFLEDEHPLGKSVKDRHVLRAGLGDRRSISQICAPLSLISGHPKLPGIKRSQPSCCYLELLWHFLVSRVDSGIELCVLWVVLSL